MVSGNNGTNGVHHHCKKCVQRIRINSENESDPYNCEKFKEHLQLCNGLKLERLELPSIGEDIVYFKSYMRQQFHPFYMLADFETKQVINNSVVKIDKR